MIANCYCCVTVEKLSVLSFVFVSEAAILVTSVTWCIPDMLWFVDVSFVGFKFTRHAVYHVRSEGPEQLHLFFSRVLMSPGTKTTGGKQN